MLSQQGLRSLDDFIKYASGEVVSKLRKRPVRRIIIFHNAVSYCVYLKQQRQYSFMHWFRLMRKPRNDRLASTRESVILEMCRESKIPVMETIAVGERSILCFPVAGFILVNHVEGSEFTEVYLAAPASRQRAMLRAYGRLVGRMHEEGIDARVRPRDLICTDLAFNGKMGGLVLIDRERGRVSRVDMNGVKSLKQIILVWCKNARPLEYPGYDRLLCFWSGYCSERPDYRSLSEKYMLIISKICSDFPEQVDEDIFKNNYGRWVNPK